MRIASIILCWLLFALAACGSGPEKRFITVASTTSTQNSGLFDQILPRFTEETGIEVRVVAVGTGQAIRLAAGGDADVLLVHHTPSEENFVAEGHGVERFDLMYNDFVVLGPSQDPAGVRGLKSAPEALRKIADAKVPFVSRGDDSGTHKKELGLWKDAGTEVASQSGTWYRELGAGMGATLNTAAGMGAYTLSDRATWISFANKSGIEVLSEGDARLFNPYGVIAVNPVKHPHVKHVDAHRLVDWLIGPDGQKAIAQYRMDDQQLFFPNAAGGP